MGADYEYQCPKCGCNEYHAIEHKLCPRCNGKGSEFIADGQDDYTHDVCSMCDGDKVIATLFMCVECGHEFSQPAEAMLYDDE